MKFRNRFRGFVLVRDELILRNRFVLIVLFNGFYWLVGIGIIGEVVDEWIESDELYVFVFEFVKFECLVVYWWGGKGILCLFLLNMIIFFVRLEKFVWIYRLGFSFVYIGFFRSIFCYVV